MDAEAFVQENKRWLVGCAIGGLVWLVGSSVINSIYKASVPKTPRGAIAEAYNRSARDDAQEEGDRLGAELSRLKTELSFVLAPKYGEWTGPADQHLFLSGRDLKRAVVDAASDRDVVVDEKDIGWEVPSGIDQIKRVLFGLDMLDAVQSRLFAAHDKSKDRDEDAMGLVSVDTLKLEATRSRAVGRSPRRGARRRGVVDLADLLSEQKVTLHFQADEPTIAAFLESCRHPSRTLTLDRLQVVTPARPGDPGTLKATLSGISFLK